MVVGMKVNRAKSLFFDQPKVKRSVDRTTRRVHSRFGAFVRQRAKTSIRRRKRSSQPGQPPSSHTGLLRKLIFFVYERERRSVVIGPARLNAKVGDAPATLEHGGPSRVSVSRGRRRRVRTVNIQARPFMGPAFEQEKPKLSQMWRDSVR